MSEVKIVAWKGGPCINGSQDFAQAFARKYAAECLPLVLKSDFDAQRLRADTAEADLAKLRERHDTVKCQRNDAAKGLAAAERRIAELSANNQLLRKLLGQTLAALNPTAKLSKSIRAALNPNPEAESHELAKG